MLKLNIYEKGKVVKTYETETADIMFGTLEDVIGVADIDKLTSGDSTTWRLEVGKLIIKAIPLLTPFLCDVFPGVTTEELRNTKVKELIPIFTEVIAYAFSEIMDLGSDSGN